MARLSDDDIDSQVLEVSVLGPEGANRMWIISGTTTVAPVLTSHMGGVDRPENFTFYVGPNLSRLEFRRAIVSIWPIHISLSKREEGDFVHTIKIQNSDADWDDEEQRVKVSFDVGMVAAAGTVVLGNVGFQVVILGAISS